MARGPVVSVFGSSAPREGSPVWEEARALGTALARAGCVVQTGGYGGVMAAASRGASEAGGETIGVTVQSAGFRARRRNDWIAREVACASLADRQRHLVERCDAVVVLPGGVGTLAELALAWSWAQAGETPPERPLIALAPYWPAALAPFAEGPWVSAGDLSRVRFARGVGEVLALLGPSLGLETST